jgi:hypothetical protein
MARHERREPGETSACLVPRVPSNEQERRDERNATPRSAPQARSRHRECRRARILGPQRGPPHIQRRSAGAGQAERSWVERGPSGTCRGLPRRCARSSPGSQAAVKAVRVGEPLVAQRIAGAPREPPRRTGPCVRYRGSVEEYNRFSRHASFADRRWSRRRRRRSGPRRSSGPAAGRPLRGAARPSGSRRVPT